MPAKTLQVPTPDGRADAFAAFPGDGERHPGVLLYPDAFGVRPEVSTGPAAVTGYCIGGVLAMRTAAAHPGQVAAVAGFHPFFLVTGAPDSPHRLFPEISAQVHLGLAEGDMTPGAISKLNQALDAAGVSYTTEIYPGTIHGFTMSDTDAFNPSGLQRHWDRLLPLLDRTLGNSSGPGPETKRRRSRRPRS